MCVYKYSVNNCKHHLSAALGIALSSRVLVEHLTLAVAGWCVYVCGHFNLSYLYITQYSHI